VKTEHEISMRIIRKKLKRATDENEKCLLRRELNTLKILLKKENLSN